MIVAIQVAFVIGAVLSPSRFGSPPLGYLLCLLATAPVLIPADAVCRLLYREVMTARGARSWQALLDDVAENTGAAIYFIVSVRHAGLNSALQLQPLTGERTLIDFTVRGFPPNGSWLALTRTGVIIRMAPRGARAAYHAAFARTGS